MSGIEEAQAEAPWRPEVGSPEAKSADRLFRPPARKTPAMPHQSRFGGNPMAQQFQVRTLFIKQPKVSSPQLCDITEAEAISLSRGGFRELVQHHPEKAQYFLTDWNSKERTKKEVTAFNRLVAANNDLRRGFPF
jgi:hypothetical protein